MEGEVTQRAKWNVVAFLAVVLIIAYISVLAAALLLGKIDFKDFTAAAGPIVAGVMGWVARAMGGGSSQ